MIMATNNIKLLLMKKILINLELIIGLFAVLTFTACKEDIDPIVTDLTFSRAFTPLDFNAQISNKTTAEFSWTALKAANHYVLEIYKGADVTTGTLIQTVNLDGTLVAYSVILTGNTKYTARIKAVSATEGVGDSDWATIVFSTLPENLFEGYVTEMTGMHEYTVRFKPGQTVTALVIDNGTSQSTYTLSAAEIAAGQVVMTSVPNAAYKISLMYNAVVRGVTHVLIEGTTMLSAGDDLLAAITAANPGDVIVLPAGTGFVFTGNSTITKSIKIRAISNANQPTLYVATGATATAPMFLIDPSLTLNDSIVFQNVTMTGYINNDASLGITNMITGVYDQGTSNACNIGLLKFDGCTLNHFSRQLIRLRGTAIQYINNFVVNNCILDDFGTNSTSYGIVSSNVATATINNIVFRNSTIYNFLSYLILYSNGTACNSMVIDNCTLNQITYTTGSTSRFIIDANSTVFTGAGITISDCIFGSTAAANTNGVRTTATVTVTGSYGTSDFIDNGVVANIAYSIMGKMTAYSGASAALWTAPLTGNFTFLDAAFAGKSTAGDPRWK
jgi:hypothetical protein